MLLSFLCFVISCGKRSTPGPDVFAWFGLFISLVQFAITLRRCTCEQM